MPSEFSIQPFQTQEEARAYRENMPIAMRSTVRGPVQGIASLTGMADIPAYLKRMAPPRLGGMGLGPKFWAPESEYKGYGEARQEYVENIGEAVVPGEAVAGGVQGSQLLTELAAIGVIGKQAIDLIRKYGPLAVTKIKSIFARKPGATVDDAVNEAMGVSRRDVLKAGGAGIAALAVPGAAWKLGSAGSKAARTLKEAIKQGIVPSSSRAAEIIAKVERILRKDFERIKATPRPEKIQKIIDAKRKKELEGYQNAEVDALVQELEELLPERTGYMPSTSGYASPKTKMYHGAKGELPEELVGFEEYSSYRGGSVYGDGFYTTSRTGTAKGYAGKKGKLYEVTPKKELKLFDMEQPAPPSIKQYIKKSYEDLQGDYDGRILDFLEENPKASLAELYDEMRALSSYENIPIYEVEAYFHELNSILQKSGYKGLRHKGGVLSSRPKKHEVNIYWNPGKDLDITEVVKKKAHGGIVDKAIVGGERYI